MELDEKEDSLQLQSQKRNASASFEINRPLLESSSLLPLSPDKLLVLRDGIFLVSFNDVLGTSEVNPETYDLQVTVTRDGEPIQNEIHPSKFLPSPLVFKEDLGPNPCEEWAYNQPYIYETVNDEMYNQDAHVYRYYERTFYDDRWVEVIEGTDENYENGLLSISKYKSRDDGFYKEIEERSFIKFDLSYIQTNGVLAEANLNMTSTYEPAEDLFYIMPVTSNWAEDEVTWDTQPTVNEGAKVFVDNTFVEDENISVELTGQVQTWLNNPGSSTGVALFPPELPDPEVGEYAEHYINLHTKETSYADVPSIDFIFENPNQPPQETTYDGLHLEAGDVITLSHTGEHNSRLTYLSRYETGGYNLAFEDMPSCIDYNSGYLDMTIGLKPDQPIQSVGMLAEVVEDTLAPGEHTSVENELIIGDGSLHPFPIGQQFDVEIAEGKDFGFLVSAGGSESGDELNGTNHPFEFVAEDSISDTQALVKIRVSATLGDVGEIIISGAQSLSEANKQMSSFSSNPQSDNIAKAETSTIDDEVVISDTVQILVQKDSLALTLENPEPQKLWPTLRDRDGGNPGERNIKKNIVTSLTRGGEPVMNHPLTIKAIRVEGSGGHNHGVEGEKLPQERVATFTHEGEESSGTLEAQTDQNGAMEFDYTSSMVSGKYILQAAAQVDGDSLFARDTLLVRVPELISLGKDTGYLLSGGTCDHHGPPRQNTPSRCQSPDNNHYITEVAKDSLVAAAEEYLSTHNEKIRVNDISLPLGGYFGIDSDWSGAHVSHRIGEDVDIENISNIDNLKEAFLENGWRYIPHGTSGFFPHFRFKD